MIKLDDVKTETFWVRDLFFVDVNTLPENYEAWIYHKEYGVKMLMFGMPKYQQSYEEFLELVDDDAATYIDNYSQEYMY